MRTYRGWKITDDFAAFRRGTTIYGDSMADIKRRIDSYMAF